MNGERTAPTAAGYSARLLLALLAVLVAGAANARRTQFIRDVVVTTVDAAQPVASGEWEQVPRRDDLDDVIQHPTPGLRNFWLPVPFDEGALVADTSSIATYYRNLGFLDVAVVSTNLEPVSFDDDMPSYNILIVLDGISDDDRYELGDIAFEGVAALDTVELESVFRRRHPRRRFFSPGEAVDNLLTLRREYAEQGYLDTTAVLIRQRFDVDRMAHRVTERYVVEERSPLRMRRMAVVSDDEEPLITDEATVSRALADAGLTPGNVIERGRILTAENYLLNLGVFRRARVSPVAADSLYERTIEVDVSERDPGEWNTRVGYSSVEKWRLEQVVLYHNFLGQARLIGAEGEISRSLQSFSLLYGQPRVDLLDLVPVIGRRNIRLRYDQRVTAEWEEPDFEADSLQQNRTLGTSITLTRRFSRVTRIGTTAEISRIDADIPSVFGSGATTSILTQISLHGSYDTRDEFLNPSRGIVVSGELGLLDPGGTQTTLSTKGEGLVSVYYPVRKGLISAATIAGGFLRVATDDPDEVETLRSSSSFWRSAQISPVRGFLRDDITEGRPAFAYTLAKLELRQHVWKVFSVAAFADAGTGWTLEIGSTGWAALTRGGRMYSIGFGPRINWLLPVRVDIARQLSQPVQTDDQDAVIGRGDAGWKIEFGIGQAF